MSKGETVKNRKQISKIAKTIFNTALKANTLKETGDGLEFISGVLQSHPDIVRFFRDIFQSKENHQKVLDEIIAKGSVDKITAGYCIFLLEQRNFDWLPQIHTLYQRLADIHLGQDRAVVHTPFPLSAEDTKQLLQSLEKITGKKIFITEQIDKSLIAGVSVTMGSMIFDGSLSNQLLRIEKEISNAS